ncbi:MAG TPA: amidohydrolase family protein [Pyrinomonadaceae bacterium]|nr:amidohydrolase family protein [Pyrinomonadaceae bacterium]
MRLRLQTAALLLSLLVTSTPPAPRAAAPEAEGRPLAFVGVNVIPMTGGGVLRNRTVIVRRGRIERIGPARSVRPPAGALRVEGRGRYLLPGLVDFHVHLRDPSELLSYLSYGVTTVVQMSGPSGNVRDVLALRRQIASGEVLGPNLYATGKMLDGSPPIFPNVSTVVTTPAEARRAVAEQHRAGVDFIKVYNNLGPEEHRAAAEEAHRLGLAVLGHVPRRVGRPRALQAALAARQDMIAHAEEFFFTYFYGDTESLLKQGLPPRPDRSRIPEVVRMVRESGAAVTANLSFSAMLLRQLEDLEGVFADPEFAYLSPGVAEMWREQNPTRRRDLEQFSLRERAKYPFLQGLVRALEAGGVPLLVGTDASAAGMFPGKSAHTELLELVKAGLTPRAALAAATVNAGRFIRRHVRGADSFGTIEAGARADLLLLEADPLKDVANASRIAGVAVRGRWLPKDELDRLRSQYDH